MTGVKRAAMLVMVLTGLAGVWLAGTATQSRRRSRALGNTTNQTSAANPTSTPPPTPSDFFGASLLQMLVLSDTIDGSAHFNFTHASSCESTAVSCLQERVVLDTRAPLDVLTETLRSAASAPIAVVTKTPSACSLEWCCNATLPQPRVTDGCRAPPDASEALLSVMQSAVITFCNLMKRLSSVTSKCFAVPWRSGGYATAGVFAANKSPEPSLAFFTSANCPLSRGTCGDLLMFNPMYDVALSGAPSPNAEQQPLFKQHLRHATAIGCRRETSTRFRRSAWNPDVGHLAHKEVSRSHWGARQQFYVGKCVPSTSDVVSFPLGHKLSRCVADPPEMVQGLVRRRRDQWKLSIETGTDPTLQDVTIAAVGLGVGNPFDSCDISASVAGGVTGAAVAILLPLGQEAKEAVGDVGWGPEIVLGDALFKPWQHYVPLARVRDFTAAMELKKLQSQANEQLELVARNMAHVSRIVLAQEFRAAYHAGLLISLVRRRRGFT